MMVDRATVDKIVQEVMAAMQQSPAAGSARNSAVAPAKSFLTADMVQARLAGGKGSALELAANEFLTPAAMDLLQRRQVTATRSNRVAANETAERVATQRSSHAIPPATSSVRACPSGAMGLVVARKNDKVEGAVLALAREGIRFVDCTRTECWVANVRGLCEAIAAGSLAAGVAMLPYAADAMVLANKARGVRAVQGTRVESVQAAVRHLGANLLVLEHELSTFHELRAMTRTFVSDRMSCGIAGDVLAAIAQMERA